MRNNGVLSRITRPAKRVIVGTGATVIAATAILGLTATAAYADTLPNGAFVSLYNTPVPTTPPGYVSSTDTSTALGALPTGEGQMGNGLQLTLSSGQVLGVQGGSTAWGTPVVSEKSTGNPNEIWRFQRVGWVDVDDNSYPGGDLPPIAEPVFKVVNYSAAGGYTCLDADGNNIAQGGAVTSYGCDPNQFNQTNQLWIVTGSIYDPADSHLLADPSTGDLIQVPTAAIGSQLSAQSAVGQYSLINLASVVNNGMKMYNALTLSSLDTPYLDGQNSQSVLYSPAGWPATSGTALYEFKMTASA
jgi:hypothetical protein